MCIFLFACSEQNSPITDTHFVVFVFVLSFCCCNTRIKSTVYNAFPYADTNFADAKNIYNMCSKGFLPNSNFAFINQYQ